MNQTKISKTLLICLLMAAIEALLSAFYLLSIPRDPKNNAFFGYSAPRMIIIIGLLFIFFGIMVLTIEIYKRPAKATSVFQKFFESNNHLWWFFILSMMFIFMGTTFLLLKPSGRSPQDYTLELYYIRLSPVILWITLVSAQTIIGFVYLLRRGTAYKPWCFTKTTFFTCLALATISVGMWLYYQGSNSPWVRAGVPFNYQYSQNPVYGFNRIYNGDFYHKENFYSLRQIDLLKARNLIEPDFREKRVFYAFLGNIFTLVLNSYYALRFLNLILYLLSAYLLYVFTFKLFCSQPKAILAAFLFILSIIGPTHLGDLSPHMLGISFYYLWSLLLLNLLSRDRAITWQENIGLSAILGIWSLCYTTFLLGLLFYAFLLIKQKKYTYLVLPIMTFFLPNLQLAIIASRAGSIPADFESQLAREGLLTFVNSALTHPVATIKSLVVAFIDFSFVDNPLNVLITIIGLLFLRHRHKWLLASLFFLPILAAAGLWKSVASSRGYIIAGISIVLFAIVAHYLVSWMQALQRKTGRFIPALIIVVALGIQIFWANASLLGMMFPTYAYEFGPSNYIDTLNMPQFVRYTGDMDNNLRLVYGNESVNKYLRLSDSQGKLPIFTSDRMNPLLDLHQGVSKVLIRFYYQILMICLPLVVFLALIRSPIRYVYILIFFILILTTNLSADKTGLDSNSFINIDRTIYLYEGEGLRGKVHLSDEFVRILERHTGKRETISFFLSYAGDTASTFRVFETADSEAGNSKGNINISLDQFLPRLKTNDNIVEFSLFPNQAKDSLIVVSSWQRNKFGEERQVEKVAASNIREALEWFPCFEIRVLGDTKWFISGAWPPLVVVGY